MMRMGRSKKVLLSFCFLRDAVIIQKFQLEQIFKKVLTKSNWYVTLQNVTKQLLFCDV